MQLKFNRQDKIFIGTIVLVHIIFFLLACEYKRIYMGDSFEYIYEALNIKKYFFFYSGNPAMPILPEYMTQRQPGYPLVLLGVYLFAVNNWIVIVLQNVLSVFNIYYARKILLRIGYDRKYDRMLLLLIVAYPAQFINANTIAPDILLQTCTLLYFGHFILLAQQMQLKHAVLMSVWLVAGLFVKPVLYPFVLLHIFIVIFIAVYGKMKLQRMLLAAIFPLCAVLLYNYSNYTRTGKFHFSSNQSFNAIYYYASYFSHAYGKDSAVKFLQKERSDIASLPEYADRYDYANQRGIALLRQNFRPYMSYHLGNSARMLVEPGKAEMDLFTGKLTYGGLYHGSETGFYATIKSKGWGGLVPYIRSNSSMPFVLIVLLFNLFRLFGLIIFFISGRYHWILRAFTFILISYFVLAAGPIANTRYFLPVSLLAIGCSVLGYIAQFTRTEKTATA